MNEKVKWPFPTLPFPVWWKWSSSITLFAVGTFCKLWLCYLNSTKVYGKEIFFKAVNERPKNVPLVTVSNHYSCIDDPILSGILPSKTLFDSSKLRWTPAAHDICFTKTWHSIFFGLGQTLPIVRGKGVYQRGMDYSLEQMNKGGWVHIFPEGRVNLEKSWIRLKWGVGRLISECQRVPVVIPLYHLGIDDILPNHAPYVPRIGKKVTILIGEPIDFKPLLTACERLGHSSLQTRKCVTDVLQKELENLRLQTIQLHAAR